MIASTSRQARWAISIRDEMLRVIDPELDAMHARGSVEAVAATREALMSKGASWWIDHRYERPLDVLAKVGHQVRNGACRATNGMDIDV